MGKLPQPAAVHVRMALGMDGAEQEQEGPTDDDEEQAVSQPGSRASLAKDRRHQGHQQTPVEEAARVGNPQNKRRQGRIQA